MATRREAEPIADAEAERSVYTPGAYLHRWQDPNWQDPLRPPSPRIDAQFRRTLLREADWLDEALSNARDLGGYSQQALDGFRWAAGWVRFHAEHGYPAEEGRDERAE